MTKLELLKALEDVPDDQIIVFGRQSYYQVAGNVHKDQYAIFGWIMDHVYDDEDFHESFNEGVDPNDQSARKFIPNCCLITA